jgi:hypothetical protein
LNEDIDRWVTKPFNITFVIAVKYIQYVLPLLLNTTILSKKESYIITI